MVSNVLGVPEDEALRLLREFEKEQLVTAALDHWEATAKGHALAMATAASPLRRATAEKLVAEVVDRARMVNRDRDLAYRVHLLVVFGSFVSGDGTAKRC
jgi:hypothetical protein